MKTKFTREFYIPKDSKKIVYKDLKIEIYTTDADDNYNVHTFSGKRSKPDNKYRFTTKVKRQGWINKYIFNQRNILNQKVADMLKVKLKNEENFKKIKIGDVFTK